MSDDAKLSQLSIPGTHETMALHGVAGYAQCQDMSLEEQFNLGVRYLDIRCRYVGEGDDVSFAIHHGSIYQKKMFGDVLNDVESFLEDHPSETIFMRIKQEYSEVGDREFNDVFESYVERYPSLFWDNGGNSYQNPKLKNIRGKVVVLYNVAGLNFGLNYAHGLNIQDNYEPDSQDNKWEIVKNHLNNANTNVYDDSIYLNHFSAAPWWNTPYGVAWGNIWTNGKGINERAQEEFLSSNYNRVGIIAMDYVREGIAKDIIEINYRNK